MTTISPVEAFKSKQNFRDFMANEYPSGVLATLAGYPQANGKAIITFADLTQNLETLASSIGSNMVLNLPQGNEIKSPLKAISE